MAIYRLLDNPGDEDMKPRSSFEGFVPPTKNYFHMPNQWIDICAKIDSLSELKVVQYVLRHTWGYQEYDGVRNITVDEFMDGRKRKDGTRMDNGTGLSEPSVKDGIKRAIRHGYVVCTIDDRDKARVKKYYGLRMSAAFEHLGVSILPPETGGQASYPQRVSILPPEGKHLMARGQESIPRSEKDTIEKHVEKDTIEIQGFGANAPARTHLKADIEELEERIDDTLEEVKRASEKLPVVKPDILEEDDTPTVKMGAVKMGATTHEQQHSSSHSHDSLPAVLRPPGLASDQGLAPSQQTIPKRPRSPVTQAKSDTRDIQARIDAWRGYALEEKVEIVRERTAVKSWCNLHTIEEYEQVMHYLTTVDKYWSKEENKYRIGGLALAKETPKALKALERLLSKPPLEQEEQDEDYSDFDRYVGNGKEERAQLLREYEERLANGTLV